MKWSISVLACVMCVACYAGELKEYRLSSSCGEGSVVITDGFVDLCTVPETLRNTRILNASGFMLFWSENRHLSIKTHTDREWGYPGSPVGAAPAALVTGEFSQFENDALVDELKNIRNAMGDFQPDDIGKATGANVKAYFLIGEPSSYVFVTNEGEFRHFSQLTIHGFTKNELIEHVVRGVLD